LLKEAAQGGGDVSVFVPDCSAEALLKKLSLSPRKKTTRRKK
jgi:hypothetical protein